MTQTEMSALLSHCTLCPRACKVDRLQGQKGVCGAVGLDVFVSRADVHTMEEPCISGEKGSGTVFFDGCNLKCIFCQNYAISCDYQGTPYSPDALADLFLQMQEKGVHNLNLVTPTHMTAQIVYALEKAKTHGLSIPVLVNCGGYESVQSLQMLEGLVDIYLPDFKYRDSNTAKAYSHAPDYPTVCRRAIAEMVRQTGKFTLDGHGMLQKGVLVRHLLLPAQVRAAKQILAYLHRTYSEKIGVSLLRQYTPMPKTALLSPLDRAVYDSEYESVLQDVQDYRFACFYTQEKSSVGKEFIPAFDVKKRQS